MSSPSSEKNKNLLAAKASLGLSTASSTSSSDHSNSIKSNSVSSMLSRSIDSNQSSRKYPASARNEERRFSSNLHDRDHRSRASDGGSYASSRYQKQPPTLQQVASDAYDTETIDVGSVDDSSMLGSIQSQLSESKTSKWNNTTRTSSAKKTSRNSNSSLLTSETDSEFRSSFDNCYEDKIDYSDRTGATSLQSIKENCYEDRIDYSESKCSEEETHPALHNFCSILPERNHLSNDSNTVQSERSDFYESNTSLSHRSTQSQISREDFVPQRFEEMRMLLSAITPLQLEALMQEIFGTDGPPGWRFIVNKGKSGFRKDAYLSEMSLEELRNFARGMDNLGLDYCVSNKEALELIAIEFERLVTLHQNKDDEDKNRSVNEIDEDHIAFDSGRKRISDEGDNLRMSLRACSLPELRLVAERLQLDHSSCATKEELVSLIENSMPDLVDDVSSQYSQSPIPLEDFNYYSQPSQQIQNGRERSRKVRFSNGSQKSVKSLASTGRKNKYHSYDIETASLVMKNGGRDSSRFSFMYEHIWKVVALLLLLLGLIIGLSVGLTSGKGGEDKGGASDVSMPQNDPFFGLGDFYGSSRISMPSLSPSQSSYDESRPTSHAQGQPSSPNSGVVVINKGEPTMKPSVSLSPAKKFFEGVSTMPTQADTAQLNTPLPSAIDIAKTTLVPTGSSPIAGHPSALVQFSIITAKPTSLSPDETSDTETPGMTDESPYPLLGPFEETGMKMLVYGISELSQMGKTQLKMLTAAYVEQFYNEEGKGTDAIQNIVFDVAANIDITNVEPPPTRRGRRSRALQSGILLLTMTMNLSYKSFSDAVDAKTVSERPFLEETMRGDYIQFLYTNNAEKFVGSISDISAIFRGDDIPEINYSQVEEENIETTTTPSWRPAAISAAEPTPITTLKATPKPTLMTTLEATTEPTPLIMLKATPEPSIELTSKPTSAVTSKPTLLTTSSLTESPLYATVSPTYSQNPTGGPPTSYEPSPDKVVINTYSPVKHVIYTYSPVASRRNE